MLKAAGHFLTGSVSILIYVLNTVLWTTPIFALSVFKLIPFGPWRRMISSILNACATAWITINNLNQKCTSPTRWHVNGVEELSRQDWYLVIANHQSWVDILVLQRVFNRRIPFLKFFLKQQLIWVPLLGLAWWALDFPFMRRYSKSFLAKNPHLKGKDLETTRRACEKFKYQPVSVMNFVEGTRFTFSKQQRQGSPFTHLLKPRAGGMAFVLSAMGEHLHKLIDVTIDYPGGVPTFWDFVSGKVRDVHVEVVVTPISDIVETGIFSQSYFDDPQQQTRFQQWLNDRWQHKDALLESLNSTQRSI